MKEKLNCFIGSKLRGFVPSWLFAATLLIDPYNRPVVELTRTVRFCLDGQPAQADRQAHAIRNSFSAWPAMRGLGRYYELLVRCRGDVDPQTGYFINIKHIDAAVRDGILPLLEQKVASSADASAQPMGQLMREMIEKLQPALHQSVVMLQLQLTPCHSLSIGSRDMDHVLIRQQFEFSAAHRLHVPDYSDERNRDIFGKCNNPSGHGHNYKLEVCLRSPIDAKGHTCPVQAIDDLVDQTVIQKLDHKHLNIDVPQFASLNPSVENIAQVIHTMLIAEVAALGVELDEVSVWETGKTVCTYRGSVV